MNPYYIETFTHIKLCTVAIFFPYPTTRFRGMSRRLTVRCCCRPHIGACVSAVSGAGMSEWNDFFFATPSSSFPLPFSLSLEVGFALCVRSAHLLTIDILVNAEVGILNYMNTHIRLRIILHTRMTKFFWKKISSDWGDVAFAKTHMGTSRRAPKKTDRVSCHEKCVLYLGACCGMAKTSRTVHTKLLYTLYE